MICKKSVVTLTCLIAGAVLGPVAGTTWAQQARGAYTDVRKLPDGPVGERITGLIDVINANDSEKVRAFVTEWFAPPFRDRATMEEHLAVFANVYDQSRGFEFYGIRQYEEATPEDEVVVIIRNRLTRAWEAFVLHIETKSPHRISGLMFAPARPPSDLPPPKKLSQSEIVKELEAFVKRLADADAFSGTVLLAKDGKVLFKKAYGPASKRFNVPNKIDTKFNLGSMNKMFTGVAVAQLVQQGKLSLGDPLSKFVSTDWLPREITDKIKIKHLLTHTSGLGSYFNDKFMESSRLLFRELDDYKPLVAGETLAFEPGTDWQYSNTGMFLLGVVIEKVTGQSYFDYVRENIYKPAGMINTDCYEMDKPVPNLAIGYSRERTEDGEQWTNNLYKHVVKGGPAGGGFSTVEDLLRFDVALRSHKLLNPEYTEMVWNAKPELNSSDYGFGFGVRGEPGNRIVGHGGGFSGINSNLDMFLDSGYTAVVMSNYDDGAQPVASKMKELLGARP
ncbi:MAG: serine hydrolase domain-containing protein [Phycisphaerae bacterium]